LKKSCQHAKRQPDSTWQMLNIRSQNRTSDLDAICQLNRAAFAEHGETKAFNQFREHRDDILSLVAAEDGELLGHILFSPVTLNTPDGVTTGMGLGQLAVSPHKQNQGIGTHLAETGIRQLRQTDCPFIIVIGHASYYPRFGFNPGSAHNIQCQWKGIPDDTFMVLILDQHRQDSLSGVASFDGL
jgi:putative acetyltransferase